MALSKKVQRSLDPNNKHWAQDTSRFGYKFLQKYGWEDGKGLGANLDGITSHIKVVQKQDTRGVGTSDNADPWLKNTTSYDNALARLAHLGQATPPLPSAPAPPSSLFVKSDLSYSSTDAPAPKHYIPPNVRKHKLARYSEEEMRGIFATPSVTPVAPQEMATLPRFYTENQKDELDEYTTTSSMNMLDYFASSSKKSKVESAETIPQEPSSMEVASAGVNPKKRQRAEPAAPATVEAPPEAKKSKKEEELAIVHSSEEDDSKPSDDELPKKSRKEKKDKPKEKKSKSSKSKKDKKDKKDKKEKKKRSKTEEVSSSE